VWAPHPDKQQRDHLKVLGRNREERIPRPIFSRQPRSRQGPIAAGCAFHPREVPARARGRAAFGEGAKGAEAHRRRREYCGAMDLLGGPRIALPGRFGKKWLPLRPDRRDRIWEESHDAARRKWVRKAAWGFRGRVLRRVVVSGSSFRGAPNKSKSCSCTGRTEEARKRVFAQCAVHPTSC